MVTHRRRRAILTALALYLCAALYIGYFAVNAFTGAHGLRAQKDLDRNLARMQAELTQLKKDQSRDRKTKILTRTIIK